MELGCLSLQASYSFPMRASMATNASAFAFPYLSFLRNSARNPRFSSKLSGCHLLINPVRLQKLSISAILGDTSAVKNGCSEEQVQLNPASSTIFNDDSTCTAQKRDKNDDVDELDGHKMIRVCDKLIEVFMVDKPTPTDWRRLLVFSKEWVNIRPHFYKRCGDRADNEDDPGMKHKLLRLGRKLKEIDDDVQRHNELLEVIREAPSSISDIVAKRRKDFTKEFFVHLYTVAESYYDNPTEQDALTKLGNMCFAAIKAYDSATESIEALNAAELKFQDIINSPTLDAACKKIDTLAEKNQLDSTLMLMVTKAWSDAKESSMMKDEVKDILYHLYKTTLGNLQRLMPKEIRIVKYLITIKDPEEQLCALKDAFTPGEEIEGTDVDNLYTTPEKLHTWIKAVIDAYHFSREGTLIREARELMNPKIIEKLETLKEQVEKEFM